MKITFNHFSHDTKKYKQEYLKIFEKFLDNNYFILGKEVLDFEKKFSKLIGVKYSVGVANGLEAIQLALMAMEIKSGDEIITTPFSAMATTLAVLAVGATPVFVDTDSSGLLNSSLLEQALSKKTKAVLPVHLYGNLADMVAINSFCKIHKLFLIEDAAQAHLSKYKKINAGSFGNLAAFSFYPTKNLGAFGDAGAVTTNNQIIAKKISNLRNYGQQEKYIHTEIGLNSRLDELQAAFLNTKIEYLKNITKKRIAVGNFYLNNINNKNIKLLPAYNRKNYKANFHLFVIRTKFRKKLIDYLDNHKIETLIHYPKIITKQKALNEIKIKKLTLIQAEQFSNECLSIPCHQYLSNQEIEYIVNTLNKWKP